MDKTQKKLHLILSNLGATIDKLEKNSAAALFHFDFAVFELNNLISSNSIPEDKSLQGILTEAKEIIALLRGNKE
jgi:hypothetical protein